MTSRKCHQKTGTDNCSTDQRINHFYEAWYNSVAMRRLSKGMKEVLTSCKPYQLKLIKSIVYASPGDAVGSTRESEGPIPIDQMWNKYLERDILTFVEKLESGV